MRPERYQRTGRRLGTITIDDGRRIKRELYQVTAPVAVTFFSDDETWLDTAVPATIAALPRGVDDVAGNWVRCRVTSGNYQGYAAPRIGTDVLEPMPKRQRTIELELAGRITKEEPIEMITSVTLDVKEFK
jgi:hypothetical protein